MSLGRKTMRPFNTDTTSLNGQMDAESLRVYLSNHCGSCGHPDKYHDKNGFCHVCMKLGPEMASGCV